MSVMALTVLRKVTLVSIFHQALRMPEAEYEAALRFARCSIKR